MDDKQARTAVRGYFADCVAWSLEPDLETALKVIWCGRETRDPDMVAALKASKGRVAAAYRLELANARAAWKQLRAMEAERRKASAGNAPVEQSALF